MKKYLLLLCVFFLMPWAGFAQSVEDISVVDSSQAKAQVLSVEDGSETVTNALGNEVVESYQKVKVKILNGDLDDQEVELKNILAHNPLDINLSVGDKVLVEITKFADGQINYSVIDYYRIPALIFMFIVFIIFILLVGGKVGFKTILALFLSVFLIFYWLIPGVLRGHNPIVLALLIAVVSTVLTLFLIGGKSRKTLS